jgi:VWFA-related protein
MARAMTRLKGAPAIGFALALCFALTGCAASPAPANQSQPLSPSPSATLPEHSAESTAAADMRIFFGASSAPLPPPPSSCSATRRAQPTFADQSGYNRFTVQVQGAAGNAIYGLKRADFAASLDGRALPIESFDSGANPGLASLVILVDTSGSMTPKLPTVLVTIKYLLSSIDPCDEVALMAFSNDAFTLQPLTLQHDLVLKSLQILHTHGQAAIDDALRAALKNFDNATYQNRAILLISDGVDNASRTRLDTMLAEEKDRRIPVYAIGIGNPNARARSEPAASSTQPGAADSERVDANALNRLVAATGGRAWIVPTVAVDGDNSLVDAVGSIAAALGSGYAVGVVVPPETPEGAIPKFRVKGHPDAIVRVTPDALIPASPMAEAMRMPP